METINIDILRLISSLITDKEFINLICSYTHLYKLRICNLKYLTNQYKLSNIKHVSNNYMFSDIYYDFLEWNPTIIPPTIEKITFIDEFNENISEVFNFKNIKQNNIVELKNHKYNSILRLMQQISSYINLSNKYESPFYCNNYDTLTSEHLKFYGEYIQKMINNNIKLKNKIFEKYNCNELDDLLILIWGQEYVDKQKIENIGRKKRLNRVNKIR
jgi:hypothetical protein